MRKDGQAAALNGLPGSSRNTMQRQLQSKSKSWRRAIDRMFLPFKTIDD